MQYPEPCRTPVYCLQRSSQCSASSTSTSLPASPRATWSTASSGSCVRTRSGHAGTLDPIATGVLLVCVGQATRLVEYAQRLPKSYRGTFLLGRRSETDDVEREVEIVAGARAADARRDRSGAAAIRRRRIEQRPPRHSAVKIEGRRAYQLARRGVDFEPEPKTVEIHRLAVVRYEYPELVLDVDCGSGTYIRSLGRDAGRGPRHVRCNGGPGSHRHRRLHDRRGARLGRPRRPVADPLAAAGDDRAGLPSITVTSDELRELQHGRVIAFDNGTLDDTSLVATLESRLSTPAETWSPCVAERRPGQLTPTRNFTQPGDPCGRRRSVENRDHVRADCSNRTTASPSSRMASRMLRLAAGCTRDAAAAAGASRETPTAAAREAASRDRRPVEVTDRPTPRWGLPRSAPNAALVWR